MNEEKMIIERQLTNTRTNKPVVLKCTQGNGREKTGERNKEEKRSEDETERLKEEKD